jgi:hypothetical protein
LQAVLRFVHGTRQRPLLLRTITERAVFPKHKGASKAAAWLGALTRHATGLHQAPEHLYHAHPTLATQVPGPLFEAAAARDIVATGAFELPGYVADLARDAAPPPARRVQLLTECNALALQLLHAAELPRGVELVQARARF